MGIHLEFCCYGCRIPSFFTKARSCHLLGNRKITAGTVDHVKSLVVCLTLRVELIVMAIGKNIHLLTGPFPSSAGTADHVEALAVGTTLRVELVVFGGLSLRCHVVVVDATKKRAEDSVTK
jgi:hypothetical protein